MTTTKPKAGRFYEIREKVGPKAYELTEDIHIKPMGLAQRDAWREATQRSLTSRVSDLIKVDKGEIPDYVDYNAAIAQALIGEQYQACRELFADDARGWDLFVDELRDFNMVDGTAPEASPDAEGNDSASPGSSQP